MDPLYKINNGFRRCPYNPSHVVLAIRFIGHLLKCAEKSSIKLLVCSWNATHHVHPEDYKIHLSTCESQELLDGIGDIAVPDSAFVRNYKMMQKMEQHDPEKDVINLGGKVMLYYEPINTGHDYQVELYNRRFQTQEFSYRDVDEFDDPPPTVDCHSQYDLYGKIVESDAPPIGPPLLVEDNDPPSSEGSSVQLDDDPPSSEDRYENVDRADDRGAGFWSRDDEGTVRVVDNRQFYYGRRLKYNSSDQELSLHIDEQCASDDQELNLQSDDQLSSEEMINEGQFTDATTSSDDMSHVALDSTNNLSRPHKNVHQLQVDFQSNEHFMGDFPAACNTFYHVHMKEPQQTTVTMSSLRLSGGEKGQDLSRRAAALAEAKAVTQPAMTLGRDNLEPSTPPVSVSIPDKQEIVAVSQGPGVAQIARPRLVPGYGRGYQLQKMYDNLQQENKWFSDPAEAQSSRNSVGHGRGINLQRKLNKFQLGKTVGRCQTTNTSGTGT